MGLLVAGIAVNIVGERLSTRSATTEPLSADYSVLFILSFAAGFLILWLLGS